MNRGLVLFVLASFFLATPASQAQLAYQPKIRIADKGESYQVKIMDAMKMTATKVLDGTGQVLADRKKEAKSKSYVYKATILTKAADTLHPAGSKRAYEKAELTDNGNTRGSALQGKTVIIEKKGDKFEQRFEDGTELSAAQLEDLDNRPANSMHAQAFMPKGAVSWPDGSWPIDQELLVKTLPKDLALVLDTAKGKAGARLITGYYKDYEKERKFYGTIEVKIEIPLKVGTELNGVKIKKGKLAFTTTIDGRVDGGSVNRTQKSALEMDMQGTQEANGKTFVVWVEMSRTTVESFAEIKKK
jgi:hypothetical protein